jgi:hypothetical protein
VHVGTRRGGLQRNAEVILQKRRDRCTGCALDIAHHSTNQIRSVGTGARIKTGSSLTCCCRTHQRWRRVAVLAIEPERDVGGVRAEHAPAHENATAAARPDDTAIETFHPPTGRIAAEACRARASVPARAARSAASCCPSVSAGACVSAAATVSADARAPAVASPSAGARAAANASASAAGAPPVDRTSAARPRGAASRAARSCVAAASWVAAASRVAAASCAAVDPTPRT